jgi:Rps23 Pro-64 3,4-dihydroxylase Tpa1-like proline 4-hydroxylase
VKSLTDFIYFENIFSLSLCDDILEAYQGEIFDRDNHHNKTTRHLGEIDISNHDVIDLKNSYVRKKIEVDIFNFMRSLIQKYTEYVHPYNFQVQADIGYYLRQMKEGDYYKEHDDDGVGEGTGTRRMTVSICLNDNYQGGDFTFFQEQTVYSLKKGDVLMFPSNFMYPHGVREITKGTRYQLITWLK